MCYQFAQSEFHKKINSYKKAREFVTPDLPYSSLISPDKWVCLYDQDI